MKKFLRLLKTCTALVIIASAFIFCCGFNMQKGTVGQTLTCAHTQIRPPMQKEWQSYVKKICSFTTYFDADNKDRAANIALAAKKIDGTILLAGENFSFNKTVGARTPANGFKQAKIIEDGKFVLGYGGGVCQVSTTVYNAAVLSGLEISEFHPHSLQVGYVSPSQDAMVSGTKFDLKFKNNRLTPIYVRVNCNLNSVTCTIYGEESGVKYKFRSKVVDVVPRPPAVEIEGSENRVLSYGRDGTVSEGYLVKIVNGVESEKLIRRDRYLAVADIVEKSVAAEGEQNDGQNDESFTADTPSECAPETASQSAQNNAFAP